MANEMTAECKLCKNRRALRHSHILPEFLYEAAYDEKHRMIRIIAEAGDKERFLQKGVREHLLCDTCETQFSKYEGHAADILRSVPSAESRRPDSFVEVPGVDYKKFKLFHMSILWRAGAAGHPMFDTVQLGPHEEKLRTLLLSEDPGEPYEYGFFAEIVKGRNDALRELVRTPYCKRLDAHIVYCFVFFGLYWYYVASSHSIHFPLKHLFLTTDGTFKIRVANTTQDEVIRDNVRELKESGRL